MPLIARRTARYGWRPDLPDHRDLLFAAAARRAPARVDLTPHMPSVYDQGQLGSCTANAIAAAAEYAEILEHKDGGCPSRLFIYYCERQLEGTIREDAGAQIRDGMRVVATLGAPPEKVWPYDIAKFARKPPLRAFQAARHHRAVRYRRVAQTMVGLRSALTAGFPVVFGFTVYESFESPEVARTGIVEMPHPDEQILGGHAVLIAGYDDLEQRFVVRNSWGAGWGHKGYFTMPYDYVCDPGLASDFWTLTRES